ncbi:heme-degrading domain-containing protein [Streptomyces kronopolitis]|uniref:heme-degrading domain-containing protein n=1 Tax=Streptomyces kronopolitis TaxID=1612435 RepID=UPI003D955F6F
MSPAEPRAAGEVAELEEQEERLVLDSFGNDDAWELGTLVAELARGRGAVVTIGIRRGAQRLFHRALPGTSADNDAWIDRKSAVVERYGESSFLVGARFRAKGRTFEESSRLPADRFAAHGGAFPVRLRGTGVVGVVAVSGLPQADDHALVVEGLERYLAAGREGPRRSPVEAP